MTVPISHPARDTGAMLRTLLDEGYRVTFAQDPAGRAGCSADLTGPLGSHAVGLGDSPAAAMASVWPLDGDPDQEPGPVDATAAAILAGKVTALREYVGRVATTAHHDPVAALERVFGELGGISVILVAATADTGDDSDEYDAEPYCATCGHWAGIFHGLDGWQHFRGDPVAGGRRELYDAGHEALLAWTLPHGRALSPADLRVIRQALADAHTAQWRREEPDAKRAEAYAALLDRMITAAYPGGS